MEKPNIICIDDQRQVLATIQKDLEVFERHCTIQLCETAAEARDVLEDLDASGEMIAMLVCDHIMPGMNGVDFLIEVNGDERFKHTKKILLTGLATHRDAIIAINEASVDRYLEKPWDSQELIDTVRTLLTHFIFDTNLNHEEFEDILDANIVSQKLQKQR